MELIRTKIESIERIAKDINLYEFRLVEDGVLPDVEPGAHIGVHLPNGIVRHYSLLESGKNLQSYKVAVKRDKNSTGGSVYMHDKLKTGDILLIEPPKNTFPLSLEARLSVFFAGGIGITPIYSMVKHLEKVDKQWRLFYACKNKEEMAFYDELKNFKQVCFHFDDEAGAVFDIASAIEQIPLDAHLYCCGPTPMIEAFERLAYRFSPEQIHVEYFKPKTDSTGKPFVVELAKTGKSFTIEPGQTILRVLLENGIDVSFSCEVGICGTCETEVLEGIPDHKDEVLSDEQKASNKTMTICCSGSKTSRIVLNL
ncbi:MAG: PDR/VanB family oxidoreductase [Pyrinomonadaceae bacterium]|nr:PDR/VanB family oxidoreductase [Pyrinomonadaceae bacterium]MCX7639002.1 PDR/VanB family oxidoreductase [Pyrinomonadaceae bacterium]MDW8303778.1 PDR/VanB family oxidoreductase [Acidobacteriota bacterium]